MTLHRKAQLPLSIGGAKDAVRTQFAALCFRVVKDKTQILLITSRGTRRWIVPKGWPMDGRKPSESAAQEAFEEAGVEGKAYDTCLGVYSYSKYLDQDEDQPCVGMVFPLRVKTIHAKFPERGQRRREWFPQKKAARMVEEPELRQIIATFDPRLLRG